MEISKPGYSIILFDGICNLCNGSINFLISKGVGRNHRFATLQSETAKLIMAEYNLFDESVDSVILVKEGKVYLKSSAVLEIVKELPGLLKYLSYLRYFPRFLRDAVYDLIAGNRYKLFGKRNDCMIPTEDMKDLFLT